MPDDKMNDFLKSLHQLVTKNHLINAILNHYCEHISSISDLSASEVRQQVYDLASTYENIDSYNQKDQQ